MHIKSKKNRSIETKIIDHLRLNAPMEFQPKIIANEIREDPEIVRVYCNRLKKKGLIAQDTKGWFRSLYTLDDLLKQESPEVKLHGIKIEGFLSSNVTESKEVLSFLLRFDNSKIGSGKRKVIKIPYEGKDVTIQLSESGTIEINISCKKYPLTFMDFHGFVQFLKGIIGEQLMIMLNLHVVQLGIGRDFRTWHLSGNYDKSIRLDAFKNAWLQIYQHTKEDMRIETHMKTFITCEDAMHMMKAMAGSIQPEKPITQEQPTTSPGNMFG